MLPMAQVAREIFGIPGVEEALRLPRRSADNDRLVASARGMADAAEKQKALFTGKGLRDDFVDQMRAAAQELANALLSRVETSRRRVSATAAVDVQVRRGRSAVRVLSAILKPQLKKDVELWAAWRNAKGLEEPSGGRPATVPVEVVQKIVKVA